MSCTRARRAASLSSASTSRSASSSRCAVLPPGAAQASSTRARRGGRPRADQQGRGALRRRRPAPTPRRRRSPAVAPPGRARSSTTAWLPIGRRATGPAPPAAARRPPAVARRALTRSVIGGCAVGREQQGLPVRRASRAAGVRSTTAGGCRRHRAGRASGRDQRVALAQEAAQHGVDEGALRAWRALARRMHRLVDQRVLGVGRRRRRRPQQGERAEQQRIDRAAAAPSAPARSRTACAPPSQRSTWNAQCLRARPRVGAGTRASASVSERPARTACTASAAWSSRCDSGSDRRWRTGRHAGSLAPRSVCSAGPAPRARTGGTVVRTSCGPCDSRGGPCRQTTTTTPIFRSEDDLARPARVRAHPLPAGRRRVPLPRQRQHRRPSSATASSTS